MSRSNNSNSQFKGLLTIAFVVLKLTGVINWSWWWVLSPIWISVCVAFLIIIISAFITVKKRNAKSENPSKKKNRFQSKVQEMMEDHNNNEPR